MPLSGPAVAGRSRPPSSHASSASGSGSRFAPGQILAGRYRIVGLLGRGGMGEVYKADDLKLDRPVALKFLPDVAAKDTDRLQRFLNEAKMALRVTHPNVTRVYDIAEIAGEQFISMEFVDGEDLSSLLRRIGRLPEDKAVEVAQQICAGLAAAHAQGVLHRDLKPANVMLDGRGQVKITDFGLAGLESGIQGDEARAGTPAYMSPEQWAGDELGPATDIYALGLVLYELFTGVGLFRGKTPAEIFRAQSESSPTTPSSVLEGIDPEIEAIILRCLEPDPADRPSSAGQIALALPGGDPLQAALAAGQTPSPELVARVGSISGIQPWQGFLGLLMVLLGIGVSIRAADRQLLRLRPEAKPPAVQKDRARELLASLGYERPPVDSFGIYGAAGSVVARSGHDGLTPEEAEEMASGQPSPLVYDYRESLRPLERSARGSIGVWFGDPPPTLPGMIRVALDPVGRLLELEVRPMERAGTAGGDGVDWARVFGEAGFELEDFTPVEPLWNAPMASDERRAWTGGWPESPDREIRVEAAGLDGRPVWFGIVHGWQEPRDEEAIVSTRRLQPGDLWFLVAAVIGAVLAWRNVRLGRGDRRTALRVAFVIGSMRFLWVLTAHHLSSPGEIDIIKGHLAWAFYRVVLVWIFYLALEPYARRFWPKMLTSWIRLSEGRLGDPRVGRDLFAGLVGGSVLMLIFNGHRVILEMLGRPADWNLGTNWYYLSLEGGMKLAGSVVGSVTDSFIGVFMMVMVLLVMRLILRRTSWALVTTSILVLLAFGELGSGFSEAPRILFGLMTIWFALLRFGLLSALLMLMTIDLFDNMPLTVDLGVWWAGSTLFPLTLYLGAVLWTFKIALGDRRLFADELGDVPVVRR